MYHRCNHKHIYTILENSKLPKLLENCFDLVGKGGWTPIVTWIIGSEVLWAILNFKKNQSRKFWIELFFSLHTQLDHNSSHHLNPMRKLIFGIKVYKYILVCLHPINKHNASSVFLYKNGGTTHHSILHQKFAHLCHFMDIMLHPSYDH